MLKSPQILTTLDGLGTTTIGVAIGSDQPSVKCIFGPLAPPSSPPMV